MLRLYIFILIVIFTNSAVFAAEVAKTTVDPNDNFATLKFKMKKSLISQPQKEETSDAKDPEMDSLLSALNGLRLPSDPDWIESVKRNQLPTEIAEPTTSTTEKSVVETEPKASKDSTENTKKLDNYDDTTNEETAKDISQKYAETMAYSEYMRENYESSAKYYSIILNELDSKSINYNTQRSWCLFQLGNCYKHFDSSKASERFSQLINEYPNSRWSNLARIELKLLRTLKDNDIDNTLNSVSKLLSDISTTNAK